MIKITFYGLVLLCALGVSAQNYNRPVPNGVFPYEYQEYGNLDSGFVLASYLKIQANPNDPNYIFPALTIYDHDGYLAWYGVPEAPILLDFKYFPGENIYGYTSVQQGNVQTVLLDANFNVLDTLLTQNNVQDVHDVIRTANGNWIISTVTNDTMDLSAYTFDGTQGSAQTNLRGYGYEEIDVNGNLVAEWNSNDFIDPTETYDFWGYDASDFDYCHGNAYEEDSDGHILVSHRHLNSIHKINRQTGAIIWRLGGELSDFTFPNDAGFSGQHDIRRLPNGYYSLFDNGNMTGVTRGVVYDLDTVSWTATKISEYIHPQNFPSTAMGSYRIRENGNEIFGYGLVYRPLPNASIIDANQNILSEYFFQDSVVSYRFMLEDLILPQRPEIVCEFNGAYMELSVTSPHAEYAWSTGETTPTIELTQAGTYQVWVDQGMGMIGSFPFEVNDINNPPCTTGIEELELSSGTYRWFSLLGQEVKHPVSGRLYLKVYSSGHIEKIVYQQ